MPFLCRLLGKQFVPRSSSLKKTFCPTKFVGKLLFSMSYETSPILNRIKIVKGWKNPTFPTKTLNYSREVILWFKVYLFLKVYLWCQKIRLLTCEVRTWEGHQKILYLSISKHRGKKKKIKSKWKKKSFLRSLQSPLTKRKIKKARFLLYRDLRTLQKKSEFFLNRQRQKRISKPWISRSRVSSWINFSHLLSQRRFFQRQQKTLSWRKKQNIWCGQKKDLPAKKYFRQTRNQIFTPISNSRHLLKKKQQKNTLNLLFQLQKKLLFLEKILTQFFSFTRKTVVGTSSKNIFSQIYVQLTQEYKTQRSFLDHIERLYFVSLEEEEKEKAIPTVLSFSSQDFAKKIWQKKTQRQWTHLLFFFKKEWARFQKHIFFRLSKKKGVIGLPTNFISDRRRGSRPKVGPSRLQKKGQGPKSRRHKIEHRRLPEAKKSRKKEKKNQDFWHKTFLFFLTSSARNLALQENQKEPFLFLQRNNLLFSNSFPAKILKGQMTLFKNPTRLRERHRFQFLRLAQKKQLNHYQKKPPLQNRLRRRKLRFFLRQRKKLQKTGRALRGKLRNKKRPVKRQSLRSPRLQSFVKPKKSLLGKQKKKRISVNKLKLAYRLSFRYHYRNDLTFTSNLQLKYLISDLIQKYFAVVLEVKLIWPLKEFKNKKFYRLLFPKRPKFPLKKRGVRWQLHLGGRWKKQKYPYLAQNQKHLEVQEKILFSKKKRALSYKLMFQRKQRKSATQNSVAQNIISGKEQTWLSKNLSHVWRQELKKKNTYLVSKKKVIQAQGQKRLSFVSKQKYASSLVATLILFAKYLDPQPLADHLAKLIGETKKHVWTLRTIETILGTVRMTRGLGYRIAIHGRLNGSKKSRTFYIRKLNRSRSRQTFTNRVNFAMAQARATIGAFGVKIWVYF